MKVIDVQGLRGGAQTMRALLSIRELVLTGELGPGEVVIETVMVEQIGVSRTPVRAAMARLCDEGVLEATPDRGCIVRSYSELDVLDAIELRGVLEGLAARCAAQRGVKPQALQAMRQVLYRIDGLLAKSALSVEDFQAYAILNELFHSQVADACGGQTLPRQVERAAARPFGHPSWLVEAQADQQNANALLIVAQHHHWSVLEYLEARDAGRIEPLMREHARLAAQNLRFALRPNGSPPPRPRESPPAFPVVHCPVTRAPGDKPHDITRCRN